MASLIERMRAVGTGMVFLVAGTFLSGCGNTNAFGQYVEWVSRIYAGDRETYTRQDVLAVPYASIGLKIGNAPSKLIVLGYLEGSKLKWVTADPAVVVTRKGRIVQIAGFGHDLTNTAFVEPDPPADRFRYAAKGQKTTRIVDFPDFGVYGQPLTCRWMRVRTEQLTIIGDEHDVVVYQERCESDRLGWRFTNLFWADTSNGRVWKSRQHIHPELPPFVIEVLRPFHTV